MASTTSIAQLPESQQISNEFYGNISAQPQFPQGQGQGQRFSMQEEGGANMNYQPINAHPNPYGTPAVTPESGPPFPESTPPQHQKHQSHQNQQNQHHENNPNQQNYTVENVPKQSLPSRDIPMDSAQYQQDEEIQPNHIPRAPKLTSDYIRDYERANEEELTKHRQKQHRQKKGRDTINEFQVPVLISILYFIFQMPIVDTWMRKYLAFSNLYREDGNFRLSGLVFKSVLFGGVYYSMTSFAQKVNEW